MRKVCRKRRTGLKASGASSTLSAPSFDSRCVYVEQNPHLRFPQYITKIDEGYIIDSEVFQWTNQPTLIARSRIRQILTGLEQMSGSIGKLPQDFEHAVNSPRWRNAHMNIGVIRGIFT
mgnify:CR=1 FL=1